MTSPGPECTITIFEKHKMWPQAPSEAGFEYNRATAWTRAEGEIYRKRLVEWI
jgi:hypothetical protein